MNSKVERAAVKAVTSYFRQKGYGVKSREPENLGYDLDVSRNDQVFHIEVKGIQGDRPCFLISQNEVRRARNDSQWRLAIVTKALEKESKPSIFTPQQFHRRFIRKPLSYMAELLCS